MTAQLDREAILARARKLNGPDKDALIHALSHENYDDPCDSHSVFVRQWAAANDCSLDWLYRGIKRRKNKRLRIDQIDLTFQSPEHLIESTIEDYISRRTRGKHIEPVLVYYDGQTYRLFDGFHRLEAARRLGRSTILANITLGTLEEMEAEWRRYLEALKRDLASA